MKVHRVVTVHSNGRSTFHSVDHAPRTHDFVHIPGMSHVQLWATEPAQSLAEGVADPTPSLQSLVPPAGGTRFMFVSFPPDAVMMTPEFDGAAAAAENLAAAPGLAESFEPEHPGMHTTDTIDYGIVLDGEIWLELDDGQVQHLRKHDVIIQNGTRHAWRNRGERPALLAFVLIGARRAR